MKRDATCTQGKWCVSTVTGTDIDGAILRVFIPREVNGRYVSQRGNCDGMPFPNSDAAFSFALSRGYLQRYFRKAKWSFMD